MTIRKYKEFIEKYFLIIGKEDQKPIPFRLTWVDNEGQTHDVQEKYYDKLQEDYPNLGGVRDIELKARQEGRSSFILALLC